MGTDLDTDPGTDRDTDRGTEGRGDPAKGPLDGTPAAPEAAGAPDGGPALHPFAVGQEVVLRATPAYLKTADPMPMLRPPDLIDPAEVGTVTGLRPLGTVEVRFRRGSFLLQAASLTPAVDPAPGDGAPRPAEPPPGQGGDPPG